MSDYATGTVVELTGGRSELNAILSSASSRRQAVLVQLSAQWCGPCRMMSPVVARLAAQHVGKLVAIKVDIEAGAANRALASELQATSLPTFQLYIDSKLDGSVRGADQRGLTALVEGGIARCGGGSPGRTAQDMARELAAALGRVKAAVAGPEFLEASRTLLRFVDNILQHRDDPKYRRVKINNPAFAAKVMIVCDIIIIGLTCQDACA